MAPESPLLSLRDVRAGYEDVPVLRGVDLDICPGTMTAVIGANGAGKSTLLRTIFGLTTMRGGRIMFGGEDIGRARSIERLRRGITYVPQGRCNFPLMTVHENLEMGAHIRTDRGIEDDIERVCATFGVLRRKQRALAGTLSGGEQQLLEIGMALMLSPRLILVDEPSLGLAAGMQRRVFESLLGLLDQGVTILLVEQNAVQALKVANRAVVIEAGRVRYDGTGPAMLDDPEVRRAYLGVPADIAAKPEPN